MSTKSSIYFKEEQIRQFIHIYHDAIDGKYYIETQEGRLIISEKFADEVGKLKGGQ